MASISRFFAAIIVSLALCIMSAAEPMVGTFDMRDHEIQVEAMPDGPHYTIRSSGGELLESSLSCEEFESAYPDLHHQFETLHADTIEADWQSRADQPISVSGFSEEEIPPWWQFWKRW